MGFQKFNWTRRFRKSSNYEIGGGDNCPRSTNSHKSATGKLLAIIVFSQINLALCKQVSTLSNWLVGCYRITRHLFFRASIKSHWSAEPHWKSGTSCRKLIFEFSLYSHKPVSERFPNSARQGYSPFLLFASDLACFS